jgi:hypothetical protein
MMRASSRKSWIDELEPLRFWQWARHRLPRSICAVLSRMNPIGQ